MLHKAITLLPFELLQVVNFLRQVSGKCFVKLIGFIEISLEFLGHSPHEISRPNVILHKVKRSLLIFRVNQLQKVCL